MAPKEPNRGRGQPAADAEDDPRGRTTGQTPVPRSTGPSRPTTTGQTPVRRPATTGPVRPVSGTRSGPVLAPRTTGQIPAQRTTGQLPAQRVTGQVPVQAGPATSGPRPAVDPSNPFGLTQHQLKVQGSEFSSAEAERRRKDMLGGGSGSARLQGDEDDEESERTSLALRFDGKSAPSVLTGRDLWKAVQAPIQSREGRRDVELYEQVIYQFAVGTNPRYEPDGPGKPRGHIFAWDVSRAMNCEIPHFAGARELTLAQTVDWVRHEGPMRGWTRVGEYDVFSVLESGQLVVALPRDIKLKFVAVVAPQDPAPDGKPLLTGAGLKRGAGLSMFELFGARQAEFFTHP